jgi:hypothetical protein
MKTDGRKLLAFPALNDDWASDVVKTGTTQALHNITGVTGPSPWRIQLIYDSGWLKVKKPRKWSTTAAQFKAMKKDPKSIEWPSCLAGQTRLENS